MIDTLSMFELALDFSFTGYKFYLVCFNVEILLESAIIDM